MWTGQPFLYHARLSVALNLKLLHPREVVDAALEALREGRAGLASVEGFVRQIIGWREFIRGVYWLEMPGLAVANHFGHVRDLPRWFWSGETHMACQREVITQTLRFAYAHHIQRLMVTGLFASLAGIDPRQVAHWYLAVYVDAVEWVELPNVAGMALYANGGRFTSKPYVASGAYIQRMSNYCTACRYHPAKKTGADACPLTTLYWHFLDRHQAELGASPRTALMVKNLQRIPAAERTAVRQQAETVLQRLEEL
jgi:deoxyribodipyrimidine photolyase-related protein